MSYDATEDLLTFRGPGPGPPPWCVVRLEAPAGATLDAAGDVPRIGPDTWTATQCLLLAPWDHPAGLRFAPRGEGEGPAVEVSPGAGSSRPGLLAGGPAWVAVSYDAGADRLTFRRPGAAPSGGPAARLTRPEGARLSPGEDRLVIGPGALTATGSWLRALRCETPELRLAPCDGESPGLRLGVQPASRGKKGPVVGGAGGASS